MSVNCDVHTFAPDHVRDACLNARAPFLGIALEQPKKSPHLTGPNLIPSNAPFKTFFIDNFGINI